MVGRNKLVLFDFLHAGKAGAKLRLTAPFAHFSPFGANCSPASCEFLCLASRTTNAIMTGGSTLDDYFPAIFSIFIFSFWTGERERSLRAPVLHQGFQAILVSLKDNINIFSLRGRFIMDVTTVLPFTSPINFTSITTNKQCRDKLRTRLILQENNLR